MEPLQLTMLLVYIAVVVTVIAVSARRAIRGLAAVTKPTLSISTVTLGSLAGVMCDPRDTGVRVSCVVLTSPLSLRLASVSYTVQASEHDQQISGLSRVQAIAVLRDRGFDERTFAIPDLQCGAYFHPGQDVVVAALALPVARGVQRLDALLTVVDAAGRSTHITVNVTDRRWLSPPIDVTSEPARQVTHELGD